MKDQPESLSSLKQELKDKLEERKLILETYLLKKEIRELDRTMRNDNDHLRQTIIDGSKYIAQSLWYAMAAIGGLIAYVIQAEAAEQARERNNKSEMLVIVR